MAKLIYFKEKQISKLPEELEWAELTIKEQEVDWNVLYLICSDYTNAYTCLKLLECSKLVNLCISI